MNFTLTIFDQALRQLGARSYPVEYFAVLDPAVVEQWPVGFAYNLLFDLIRLSNFLSLLCQ